VLGKGNKERIIPVSKELIEEIQSYMDAKKDVFPENELKTLFLNEKGNSYIQSMFTWL
jgi:integrase/recombinase XerC